MWVKFDRKTCKINLDGVEGTIPINKWIYIIEYNGKLYISGKKLKKEVKKNGRPKNRKFGN